MTKFIFALLVVLVSVFQLEAQSDVQEKTYPKVPVYEKYADMEHLLHQKNDTTYIVNFWATWCGPCVKELPYIEQLHETYAGEKIAVILVSLDFPKQIESKLLPFIDKQKLKSRVVVLTDGAYNSWIDKVHPEWDGAIPVTIVYNAKKRHFTKEEFHNFEELNSIVKQFINN